MSQLLVVRQAGAAHSALTAYGRSYKPTFIRNDTRMRELASLLQSCQTVVWRCEYSKILAKLPQHLMV